jgi:hypothetical protein
MAIRISAITAYNTQIIEHLKQNPKLKGKVFHLTNRGDSWELPPEGILFIDVEAYGYRKDAFDGDYEEHYQAITEEAIDIPINDQKIIKSLDCFVNFLPDDQLVKYFKRLAQLTQSKVGLMMLHERGDSPYDEWAWAFDYSVNPPREFFDAMTEAGLISKKHPFLFWGFSGCPFQLEKYYDGDAAAFDPEHRFYNLFQINWFPCITDLPTFKGNETGVESIW